MKMKRFLIFVASMAFLTIAVAASAEMTTPYPSAKDYLTPKVVSPIILKAGTLPNGYLFPNDWVKRQNWDEIRKKYAGTELDIIFEGTDIGAPLMTKEQFEKMSGMKLNFTGVPNQVQMQKLLVSFATGSAAFDVTVVLTPNLPVFIRFLEPLDDLIKKWGYDFDDYFPHFQSLMSNTPLVAGGKIYGLPNDYDQHYWHSRKNLLDKIGVSGPPKTWDEVVEYSKKLKSVLPDSVFPTGFMMSRDLFAWESFWDRAAPPGRQLFQAGNMGTRHGQPRSDRGSQFSAPDDRRRLNGSRFHHLGLRATIGGLEQRQTGHVRTVPHSGIL